MTFDDSEKISTSSEIKTDRANENGEDILNFDLLMSVGEGIIVTDPSGTIKLMNTAAERICRCNPLDVLGHNFDDVFNILHIHTRERVKGLINSLIRTGNRNETSTDYIVVLKDGSEVRLSANIGFVHSNEGEVNRIILSFQTGQRHVGPPCR